MHAHFLDGQSETVPLAHLLAQGVTYEALPVADLAYQAPLDALKARQGYIEQDIVELSPATPNLDTICAKFIDEHTHDDDEVRFVLEGAGIFDIRDDADRWMRVVVEQGDLIVVPKDRNHRFQLTEAQHIKCVRLFKDKSGWVPHYRGR